MKPLPKYLLGYPDKGFVILKCQTLYCHSVEYLRTPMNHEEADTRICRHAKAVDDTGMQGGILHHSFVIRASDTGISVIKFQSPL